MGICKELEMIPQSVVDNEGLGRKSSKVRKREFIAMGCFALKLFQICCIFHPSESEESDDEGDKRNVRGSD